MGQEENVKFTLRDKFIYGSSEIQRGEKEEGISVGTGDEQMILNLLS